jgi:hypothetical protein
VIFIVVSLSINPVPGQWVSEPDDQSSNF